MALQDDLEVLVNFGLFNDGAVARLASVIRTVQTLAGGGGSTPTGSRRRGRPAGSGRGPGRPKGIAKTAGKRAPRGSFNPSKEELAKFRETMTGKEIAAKFGVSPVTVANKAKKLGLTTPRGKGKK